MGGLASMAMSIVYPSLKTLFEASTRRITVDAHLPRGDEGVHHRRRRVVRASRRRASRPTRRRAVVDQLGTRPAPPRRHRHRQDLQLARGRPLTMTHRRGRRSAGSRSSRSWSRSAILALVVDAHLRRVRRHAALAHRHRAHRRPLPPGAAGARAHEPRAPVGVPLAPPAAARSRAAIRTTVFIGTRLGLERSHRLHLVLAPAPRAQRARVGSERAQLLRGARSRRAATSIDLVRREQKEIDLDPTKGGVVNVLGEDVDRFDVQYLEPIDRRLARRLGLDAGHRRSFNRLPLQVKIRLVLKGGGATAPSSSAPRSRSRCRRRSPSRSRKRQLAADPPQQARSR